MSTLQDVIPINDFPKSLTPVGRDPYWLLTDDKRNYRRNGGHPIYGERDIVYRFNKYGYRAPEFDTPSDVRILSIGDETTFGLGMPADQTYPELVVDRLRKELGGNVGHWNISSPSSSGEYIARMLPLVVPRLNPHLVIVLFPQLGRREFMTAHGNILTYVPGMEPWDAVSRDVYGNFDLLVSEHDNQFNFYRNYKAAEVALYDCEWIFGLQNPKELTLAAPHVDRARDLGFDGELLDTGRDRKNAGPKTHALLADLCWSALDRSGALSRISAASSAGSTRVGTPG